MALSAVSDRAYNPAPVEVSNLRRRMDWARMLADITGTVDQELLLRNEYLATETRILKAQLKGRLLLTEAERATLGGIGHRLGRKALKEAAAAAKPETILGRHRRLIARKFDGSKRRRSRLIVEAFRPIWWPIHFSPGHELAPPSMGRSRSEDPGTTCPAAVFRTISTSPRERRRVS